jgi:type II secretion system protein H
MKCPVPAGARRLHDAPAHRGRVTVFPRPPGFTLIELILVMAILAAVMAVSAPSLGRFFRGRNLDSEAYRLLALTRHAQERAVTEGVPMILWFDINARRYGLMADPSWSLAASGSRAGNIATMALDNPNTTRTVLQDDPRASDFGLAEDVELEVETATVLREQGSLDIQETPVASRPLLRFQPDGFIPLSGPDWIVVRSRTSSGSEADASRLWIAPGVNRQAYEIWTNQPPIQVR